MQISASKLVSWILGILCLGGLHPLPLASQSPGGGSGDDIRLVIHGGAGAISRGKATPEIERDYRRALAAALEAGAAILRSGGSSLDAVETAIRRMEDDPLFNAGKGAVFTLSGTNELDASIMDGHAMTAGAVAGVTTLRNPISGARMVMEATPHVLMIGEGAEALAGEQGLQIVEPGYFYTERRWQALQRLLDKEKSGGATGGSHFGTVGAVALDRRGRLAAGTSTGGTARKLHGRVGDSPIVGAGTYADARCGVSGTGHGEYFIRHAVAFNICARMRYLGEQIGEAASQVVEGELVQAGGQGGVIALDSQGNFALVFNSPGMYRGWIGADGEPHVAIFGDEEPRPPVDPMDAAEE